MKKPLPCESCIIFPICRPIYMKYKPTVPFIKHRGSLIGYDTRALTMLKNRCSILRQYFNNYLNSEVFCYRRTLMDNYFETPIEGSDE